MVRSALTEAELPKREPRWLLGARLQVPPQLPAPASANAQPGSSIWTTQVHIEFLIPGFSLAQTWLLQALESEPQKGRFIHSFIHSPLLSSPHPYLSAFQIKCFKNYKLGGGEGRELVKFIDAAQLQANPESRYSTRITFDTNARKQQSGSG